MSLAICRAKRSATMLYLNLNIAVSRLMGRICNLYSHLPQCTSQLHIAFRTAFKTQNIMHFYYDFRLAQWPGRDFPADLRRHNEIPAIYHQSVDGPATAALLDRDER